MLDDDLLKEFVPCLRYDSQAVFTALSAASMTNNPGNHVRRGKSVEAWAGGVPSLSLATLAGDGHKKRDRLHQSPGRVPDALRLQRDPRYAHKVHGVVHARGKRVLLQYWFWFYGTEFGTLGSTPRDSGVWRLVQIELDASRNPAAIVVETERRIRRSWVSVETLDDGRRAVVYVSPRIHYFYLKPGQEWHGFAYDGGDGDGREEVPALEPFTGWEHWPGKWPGKSPARQAAWKHPNRVARFQIAIWIGYVYVWLALLPLRIGTFGARFTSAPQAPTLNARLERDRIVVGYRVRESSAYSLKLSAHVGREVLAAGNVDSLESYGEATLPLTAAVDACELRVSAYGIFGMRTVCPPIPLRLNEPDGLEAGILQDVVATQLASREVSRYARRLRVRRADMRRRLDEERARIWSSVASELQAFRDARSAQSQRRNAEARKRSARRTLFISGGIAGAAAAGFSGIALLSKDRDLVVVGAGVAGVLALTAVALSWAQWNRWRRARGEAQAANANVADLALVAARRRFERALREKGVAPRIREEINARTMDRYTDSLSFGDEGLPELRALDQEIPTQAMERLAESTRRMRGGSIGIAGPRGAGKTTLIQNFCTPRTADDRRLTTVIAAPVRYEARDFILTLFARLCETVLGSERADARDYAPANARLVARAVPILPVLVLAGGLGWLQSVWEPPLPARFALGALCLAALVGAFGLVRGVSRKSYLGTFRAFLLAALVLGALALRGEVYRPDLYLHWVAIVPAAIALSLALLSRPPPAPGSSSDIDDQLVARAHEHLRNIRFQQSYSTGYSGKLSLVGGAEASVQTREDLAQRQESLPEIVEQLRGFLALAAQARGSVAIGIDEMDKMESAEIAQQFLNEIKGIFGVDGCFYLVSISEDAMASFERRGLPLRDVFDSSFDDVLSVGALSLKQSKLLLRGRVLGLGPSYLDLCHCLSGGLARDVLRVVRQLSFYNPKGRARPLSLQEAVKRLVSVELSRKVEAIAVSAQRIPLEPHGSELMFWIRELARCEANAPALLACCAKDPRNWPRRPTKDDNGDARTLERLRLELATFTYYVATLLEFFTGDDAELERRIRAAENGEPRGDSALDQLAGARIAFAVNPLVAVEIVNDFRRSRKGWQVLSFTSP